MLFDAAEIFYTNFSSMGRIKDLPCRSGLVGVGANVLGDNPIFSQNFPKTHEIKKEGMQRLRMPECFQPRSAI